MRSRIRPNRKLPKIRLIKRQEIWMLTIQGWVIAIAFIATLICFTITNIHPFLAVNYPIQADVLVVEGWIPDYALKAALAEFKSGSYRQLITTGVPLDRGFYLAEYNNFANLAAATLKALGLEEDKLVAVAAPEAIKDRTHASAIALRQWLVNSNLKVESINFLTLGTHTRRSWLIFKEVLAPKITVGVITVQPLDYAPNKWWISSAGVRSVIDETIAYLYASLVNSKA